MSSQGGGSPQIQDNSLMVEQMRQQAAREEQARQDALKAQQRTDFTNNLSNAVTGAKTTGRDYFTSRGLSPDDYSSLIDSIVNDTRLKVPDLDPNPASYFNTDTFASGIDNWQNLQRANYNSKVGQTFAPGFDTTLIPDTADDSIINSILGEQRKTAQQQLDFNRARGLLNDSGYNASLAELGREESAGRSTLSDIGSSVLGKSRQDLLNIRGEAGDLASGYTIGNPTPDIGSYYTKAQNKATENIGGLEGAIRSALGGTNLFDVSTILGKGGTTQGPINLTTAETAPGVPFATKKTQANRGLGSTGVF